MKSSNEQSHFLQLVFKYAAKKMLGYEESKDQQKLRDSYKAFMDGLISFPLNIPGTPFHACLQVINCYCCCSSFGILFILKDRCSLYQQEKKNIFIINI